MADVRAGGPGWGGGVARRLVARPGPSPDGDRGQLILVTALSLAILFVALALILNTAIYTENLATRSSDIGGGTDAVRYHDAARDGVGGVIEYSNAHNNTSHVTLQANLSAGVEAFRNQSARQFVHGDRAVETTLNATANGTHIAQSDADRNFTNTSGEADWTLVEDVDHTRAVTINVTDDTNLETIDTASVFELVLDDSTNTWRLNVTDDSGTTVVGIKNGADDHFECTASSDTPFIDVTAGPVGGDACDGLDLAEGLTTPYTISINNGDNINGTYSIMVNNSSLADTVEGTYPHLAADGSGQPFAAHAIYSANVTVVYQTPRLYYNTTVRVAPEEADD